MHACFHMHATLSLSAHMRTPPSPLSPPVPLQDLLESNGNGATDASGNPILQDIGTYLKGELKKDFKVGGGRAGARGGGWGGWGSIAWAHAPTRTCTGTHTLSSRRLSRPLLPLAGNPS